MQGCYDLVPILRHQPGSPVESSALSTAWINSPLWVQSRAIVGRQTGVDVFLLSLTITVQKQYISEVYPYGVSNLLISKNLS